MKVIEFLGMPRAGKTTQLRGLETYLKKRGNKVDVLWDRERALELLTPPDQAMAYQLVFFSYVIEEYYKAQKEIVDYFIIDRGFQDALVWADVLHFLGDFTEKEKEANKECFSKLVNFVDKTFYFSLPLDVVMKRHDNAEHEAVDDVAMNMKYMEALEKAYQCNLKPFRNLSTIDGTLSIAEIGKLIINSLG